MDPRRNQKREKKKKNLDTNKMEIQHTKTYGNHESSSKREVNITKGLNQETREILNNLRLHLKAIEKKKT